MYNSAKELFLANVLLVYFLFQHILCVLIKTMRYPVYYQNGFVETHALGQMMYGYPLLVPMNQR